MNHSEQDTRLDAEHPIVQGFMCLVMMGVLIAIVFFSVTQGAKEVSNKRKAEEERRKSLYYVVDVKDETW